MRVVAALLRPERDHWIDTGGAAGGEVPANVATIPSATAHAAMVSGSVAVKLKSSPSILLVAPQRRPLLLMFHMDRVIVHVACSTGGPSV